MEPIKKPELELSERDRKELRFAEHYVNQLDAYGTDGHGRLVLIEKMLQHIRKLDEYITLKELG